MALNHSILTTEKNSSTGTEDKTEILSKCDQIAISIMVSDISILFINILFCFNKQTK